MSAKVAIICLCYNHEKYVEEAMESVLNQTYASELIVVDDASTDNSVDKIRNFIKQHPEENINSMFFDENIGNCKAFNAALMTTDADYIIDLAADDVLLPTRVSEGTKNLDVNPSVAINFTNAEYIDEYGRFIKSHYLTDQKGMAKERILEGDVFKELLQRYFICSPTMMYRASFLKRIGGYDEELAYEDFDIMLRLSRSNPFSYTDKVLVKKRVLKASMSTKQYKKGNKQLESTLKICKKAFLMIQSEGEKKALLRRIVFEAKQAFIHKRFLLFSAFINLGVKTILQK
ncbi:Glycosyl transferase family 2 [Marivirga sericea]|uniref:Glycosyl transferase family 2 n=1 Tax=Marivirga sericea TaxID=1028 RepID=A0A1X7I330_9BACT|nr:glycosyltransferase [Marivirga sericea]SMG08784.1 Glycosyl transferase family 2 [Marivirga sericea]